MQFEKTIGECERILGSSEIMYIREILPHFTGKLEWKKKISRKNGWWEEYGDFVYINSLTFN